jgi:hypothetical protein
MTPQLILAVAAGGALGSVARYLAGVGSGKLFGTEFPWGTLIMLIFDWCIRWPFRSQMGFVAGNAERLHDFFHILSGHLLLD